MLSNIKLEEAQERLLSNITVLDSEIVSIIQALGRVNSREMFADHNLPPCFQAARDGFAVHTDDLGSEQPLLIKTMAQAGDIPASPIKPGEAVGVVTGGRLPDGTGAVIPWEQVQVNGQELFFSGYNATNSFIKKTGEDFQAGEIIAEQGFCFTPGMLALFAALGTKEVMAYRRPRVAILSLGEQVIPYQKEPVPGQMRDSNGPLLAALVMRDGGEVIAIENCTESPDNDIETHVVKLLEEADLVLTIGGTFAYEDSEAYQIFKAIGSSLLFQGIPIQPGGHNAAFRWNSQMIICHSGNPAACLVGYELLSAPVLRAMQGLSPYALKTRAICLNDLPEKKGDRRFIRGYAKFENNKWKVKVLPGQKPGMLRSLINYNSLIDIPTGNPPVKAGDEVSIILVNSFITGNEYF